MEARSSQNHDNNIAQQVNFNPTQQIFWTCCLFLSSINNSSFSLSRNKHGTKKYIWNRPVEEAKKMKRYERLIYKQFVQISGLCDPQFLSYLPKHFTHLCRALYGDAILVDRKKLSTNMAAGNQQKHLEFTFSIKAPPFHSRTSILAHKHIF